MMLTDIEVALILPHPENSNRMDAETLAKLRKHIERTGRYEPIIVRPHPDAPGRFQVINGHHRLQVLKALGRTSATCVVWEVDDAQARLYLATLNRLGGEDIPERRALLIGSLLESFDLDELMTLLPEDRDRLAEFERLVRAESEEIAASAMGNDDCSPRVILEFFLDPDSAKEVNLALDLATHRHPGNADHSTALVNLARSYLGIVTSERDLATTRANAVEELHDG